MGAALDALALRSAPPMRIKLVRTVSAAGHF